MHTQTFVLDAIGNTPLVELRHIVPKGSAGKGSGRGGRAGRATHAWRKQIGRAHV